VFTRRAAYWSSTSLAALAFAGMGAANLAHAPTIMEGLRDLGYPPYFPTIIGAWKVLGAVAILAPGLERAKEWAYAGMFFTLTGAALSHALKRDAADTIVAPLVLLGIVMLSWRLVTEQRVQRVVLRQRTATRSRAISKESDAFPNGEPSHVGH
jgi:hypothetical protein